MMHGMFAAVDEQPSVWLLMMLRHDTFVGRGCDYT